MFDTDTLRLIIPDLGDTPVFSDDELDIFLTLNEDNPYLAAASALESMATAMAMAGGADSIKTDDLSINGKEGVAALFTRAKQLRADGQGYEGDAFYLVYPYQSGLTL